MHARPRKPGNVHESASETDLYYYRARYYDASSGRFLNEDRLGFEGGINLYRYARNSPLNWTDPSGTSPQSPVPGPVQHLCFRVTSTGTTEEPCADPNGGMTCINNDSHCLIPITPAPPAGPLHHHDTSPGCACDPAYLMKQVQNIRTEAQNNNKRTVISAYGTSGALTGLELGLDALGVGVLPEFILPADLLLLLMDIDEVRHNNKLAEERIKILFEPCID
jgi:RHS repeat-associated protein